MTAAFFGLALLGTPQFYAPQLRTILPSGAVILADNKPGAKSISVQLFASARGVEETDDRHGWRHLLEHLILKGRDPKSPLDVRVESKGIFVQGRTYRDAMQIEITVHVGQEGEAFDILKEVTRPLVTTPEEIATEVAVLREELALSEDALMLGQAAWMAAYGRFGLDAQGNLEVMAKATPEGLAELQAKHFVPKNLVLVISGPIKLDEVTAKASAFLSSFRGDASNIVERPLGLPGRTTADEAFGEGRAVPVGTFASPETAAVIIGAFGIAARHPGAFVSYTPSMSRALVVVGQTESNGGIGREIDEFVDNDWAQVYTVGMNLSRRWLQNYLATPSGSAYLWGLMLLEKPEGKVEEISAAFSQVSFEQFKREATRFGKEKAVTFVGAGS